jgi:membrane-associated phospholipid phosphatase
VFSIGPAPASNAASAPRHAGASPVQAGFPRSLLAIAALAAALLCWLGLKEGFVATPYSVIVGVAPNALMGAGFLVYRARGEQTFAYIFAALGLMASVAYVDAWLAIVGLTAGFPLEDALLMAWSHAVGIDHRAILEWLAARPLLGALLSEAYLLSVPMMFLAPVVLAVTGQFERLGTFVWLYVVLLTGCVVISIVVPAKGFVVYQALPTELMARLPANPNVSYAKLSEAYRSGALRTLDPSHLDGVVVFPSFHTIMALLAIYAFWRTRVLWLLSLGINAIVLMSVVPIGGHYVWDVVGGALMFAAAVRLAPRLTEAPASNRRAWGQRSREPDPAASNSATA